MKSLTAANPTNMMTPEDKTAVIRVYNHFLKSEEDGWSNLDDNLEMMDLLSDEELANESIIRQEYHKQNGIKCVTNHDPNECFATVILESVDAILKLYEETKELHLKNRYILLYYMAMSEMRIIF